MHVSQHYTNSLIKLFRRTDQRVDLLLKDWDRRPIKFEDYEEIWFKLFDGQQQALDPIQANLMDFDRGWYVVEFNQDQTGNLNLGKQYSWCIICKDTQAGTERMLFTDLTYGAAAPCEVVEGPLPPQSAAQTFDLTWLSPLDTGYVTTAFVGGAQLINPNGAHSVVLDLDHFTGVITVEVSLDPEIATSPNGWVGLDPNILTDSSGPYHIGFSGNYNWFRVKFSSNVGVGTTMTYRNA